MPTRHRSAWQSRLPQGRLARIAVPLAIPVALAVVLGIIVFAVRRHRHDGRPVGAG